MRRYFAKVVDPNGHPTLKEKHVQIQEKPFATLEVGELNLVDSSHPMLYLHHLGTKESPFYHSF